MKHTAPQSATLLAKNSILNLVGQVLPMIVGVATVPYIIRGLGTNGYGILSIAFMVLGYFSIFDLGLSRATVKFVAAHLSPDKLQEIPQLVWTSLACLTVFGCIGAGVSAAFVPMAVTKVFKMPVSYVPEARLALYLLSLSLPVMLLNDTLRGVLEASQRFDLVNYVKIPGSVCFYLLAAAGISIGMGISGTISLLILVRITTACVYFVLCLKVFPSLKHNRKVSLATIRPLMAFGGWVMISNIAGPVFSYLERFLIASILSVSQLTFYSAPFDLVSKMIIFPAAVAPAIFSFFSADSNRGQAADTTSQSLKYLLLVMTPITVVFVVFAKEILQLWLGIQFATQSADVLRLLALACFLNGFAYIPYSSVQALGRPELKATLDLLALPTYALGAWWLMSKAGIDGAALAKLLITVVDCVFLFAFARRMGAFSVQAFLSGSLLRALIISGSLMVGISLIAMLHLSLIITAIFVAVLIGCYLASFWLAAMGPSEKNVICHLYRDFAGGLGRAKAVEVK